MGKWELDEVFDFTMEIASGQAGHAELLAEKITRDTVRRYCKEAKLFRNPSYHGIDLYYESSDRIAVRLNLWATRCSNNEEVILTFYQLWFFKDYEKPSLGLERIIVDLKRYNGLGFDWDVSEMLDPYFEDREYREIWGVID